MPVHIPDPVLRLAIEKASYKSPGETITVYNMRNVYSSDFRYDDTLGSNITDLSGLEFADNLTEIDLSGNQISDITPLGHLNQLQKMQDNRISDISPLLNKPMNLLGNPLTDLSPFCTKLPN